MPFFREDIRFFFFFASMAAADERNIAVQLIVGFEAFEQEAFARPKDSTDETTLVFLEHDRPKESFQADRIYWGNEANQRAVTINRITQTTLDHVASGKNFAIIAVGETVGRSSTVFGEGDMPGLIEQVLVQIVDAVQGASPSVETTTKVSAVEIAAGNEKIRDILSSTSSGTEYRVRNHPEHGYFVENAVSMTIGSKSDLPAVVSRVLSHDSLTRKDSSFASLTQSKSFHHVPSHTLVQITVKRRDGEKGILRSSTVWIAEVVGAVGSRGESKSLSTLRRVVEVLYSNRRAVPPTREAVLTTLLTEALGGNCSTLLLGQMTSPQRNQQDSLNLLRMTQKARSVVCAPRVNDEKCTVVVKAIEQQMEQMRRMLSEDSGSPLAFKALHDQLAARTQEVQQEREEKEKLKASLEAQVDEATQELTRLSTVLHSKQLLREEAMLMEQEVQRLQSMRDLAAQRFAAENEISHRVEEELLKAKELEQQVIEAEQRAREQREVARIENEKQQKRMMATIFRTSKMIGEERRQTAGLVAEMGLMRSAIEELELAISRVDARIDVTAAILTSIASRCAFLQDAEGAALRGIKTNEDLSLVQELQRVVLRRQDDMKRLTAEVSAEEEAIREVQRIALATRAATDAAAREADRVADLLAQDEVIASALDGEITQAVALSQTVEAEEVTERRKSLTLDKRINEERAVAAALRVRLQRETVVLNDTEADLNSVVAAIESFREEKARLERLQGEKRNVSLSVFECDAAQRRAVEPGEEALALLGVALPTSPTTPLKKPFAECKSRFESSPMTKRFVQRIT